MLLVSSLLPIPAERILVVLTPHLSQTVTVLLLVFCRSLDLLLVLLP